MTVENLLSRRQGQAFNAEEALAARQILASSGEQLMALAKKPGRLMHQKQTCWHFVGRCRFMRAFSRKSPG